MVPSWLSVATASAARVQARPLAGRKAPWPVEAFLEVLRQRNLLLDWLFYDVGVVTDAEITKLAPTLAAEGAILIVPPTGSAETTVCCSVADFVRLGGADIRLLTVAGVGSSALGAAALARNVADAFGEPAAAVVSGYGFADVFPEALGGYFLFGTLNRWRHAFEWLDRLREQGMVADPTPVSVPGFTSPLEASKDVAVLRDLLDHEALDFRLLLGHSKGNLVLSEALYALQRTNPARLARVGSTASIVTVSAKIGMPVECRQVVDVLGDIDPLGAFNSTPGIRTDVRLPLATHTTNRDLHFLPIDVPQLLQGLLADGRLPGLAAGPAAASIGLTPAPARAGTSPPAPPASVRRTRRPPAPPPPPR
ncbi:hypothetical protein [Aquabacterium sp. J223]|uniref:hypothetical protein n=1 Tax=Aquabacterium sp. J223 TaxID=2898431 RepID=UPI0021ADC80D|nr:hypothetical protein [Aquabacterium sp. J223]UUX95135.1 hypothetical protein LRS07_18135 [Aquabacterium sp. J223]